MVANAATSEGLMLLTVRRKTKYSVIETFSASPGTLINHQLYDGEVLLLIIDQFELLWLKRNIWYLRFYMEFKAAALCYIWLIMASFALWGPMMLQI